MKKSFMMLSFTLAGMLVGSINLATASPLECSKYIGCERKLCEIEKQIVIAESKGNQAKVDGLKIALKEVNSVCNNDLLVEDLILDIADVEEEITEYQAELLEAQEENKPDKVKKYTHKIEKEKRKLEGLQAELKLMQQQ